MGGLLVLVGGIKKILKKLYGGHLNQFTRISTKSDQILVIHARTWEF